MVEARRGWCRESARRDAAPATLGRLDGNATGHLLHEFGFGFTIDQLVHAVTVFLAAWWIVRAPPAAEMVRVLGILRRPDNKILLLLVVYVAVIFGAGWLIRFLTKPLMRDLKLDESHAQLGKDRKSVV